VSVLGIKNRPASPPKKHQAAANPAPASTQTSRWSPAAALPQGQATPVPAQLTPASYLAPAPHSSVALPAAPATFRPLGASVRALSALATASSGQPAACSMRPGNGDQPSAADRVPSLPPSASSAGSPPPAFGISPQPAATLHAHLDLGEPTATSSTTSSSTGIPPRTPCTTSACSGPTPAGPSTLVQAQHTAYPAVAAYPPPANCPAPSPSPVHPMV
jgi:hypothetical protein